MATGSPTPMCGDATCDNPGCGAPAIDRWTLNRVADAKVLVRPWAVCDACSRYNHKGCTMPVSKGVCCCDD